MAIKIIKDGVKPFKTTCSNCGCEFTYENEDINNSMVICPCCNNPIYHKQKINSPSNENYILLKKTLDGAEIRQRIFSPDENPCDSCPNNPKYLKTPYVGDYPCQWCQMNPNKVTCTSNASKGEIK